MWPVHQEGYSAKTLCCTGEAAYRSVHCSHFSTPADKLPDAFKGPFLPHTFPNVRGSYRLPPDQKQAPLSSYVSLSYLMQSPFRVYTRAIHLPALERQCQMPMPAPAGRMLLFSLGEAGEVGSKHGGEGIEPLRNSED